MSSQNAVGGIKGKDARARALDVVVSSLLKGGADSLEIEKEKTRQMEIKREIAAMEYEVEMKRLATERAKIEQEFNAN